MNKLIFFIVVLSTGLLSYFTFWPQSSPCAHLDSLKLPSTIKQVLLVEAKGGLKAELSACTWNKGWQASLFSKPVAAVIGKQGLATLGNKKEGDLKTPAGLYSIEWAFGSQPLALKMDFKFITPDDKFIDDPKHPQYNSWQQGETSAKSYEQMEHPLYKMGAIISYNMHPIIPGAGSAIFLHIWRSAQEGTAGCVALSEKNLLQVLTWLDKTQHPYIFISPEF